MIPSLVEELGTVTARLEPDAVVDLGADRFSLLRQVEVATVDAAAEGVQRLARLLPEVPLQPPQGEVLD